MSTHIATLDLGTHSFILSISKLEERRLRPVFEKLVPLGIGRGLEPGQPISPEKKDLLLKETKRSLMDVARLGARLAGLAGTHVFRVASNGNEILQQLGEVCGCPWELLTQDREIELVQKALVHQFQREDFSTIDIGGGSTEIFTPKGPAFLPWGAVNLFEKNGFHPDQGNRNHVAKAVKKISLKLPMENLIGIGGSVTALASIILGNDHFDSHSLNGMEIKTQKVSEWIDRLADLKPEFRAQVPGLPKDRVDTIVPGLCLMEAILKRFQQEAFTVSTWGLRNGLALEYFAQKRLL